MKNKHNSPFVLTTEVSESPCHNDNLPLKGWSLAVKDVLDIAGYPTAVGNPTWLDTHPIPDSSADAVLKLTGAGACVVGKTITDELAYSLNGQNIHYPQLTNSLSVDRFCGGSSSGSAIAVANNQARIGLGTDTGGSIRVPASYNNLVGFRPTHGAVDNTGVVPLAQSFDTVGWLTRSVDDTLAVAKVLIPKSSSPRETTCTAVLGDVTSLCDYRDEFNHQLPRLFENYKLLQGLFPKDVITEAANAFKVLQGKEIWTNHGEWISQHQPKFANDIQQRFLWASTITDNDVEKAKAVQQHVQMKLTDVFKTHDWIALPTTPGPSPKLDLSSEQLVTYREFLMAFTCLAGLTGSPQCHLPLFRQEDKAYGLSIIGPKHSDIALLEKAKQITELHHE